MEGYRLSPQQKRLWLLQRADSAARYYAQADLELPPGIPASKVWDALDRLSQRHEVLRTVFRALPGAAIPLQVIEEQPRAGHVLHDLSRLSADEWDASWAALRAERAREPFDLAAGPLLRADFATRPDHVSRLLLTLPAACADTASLYTLVTELRQICLEGSMPGAPEDVLQYADVADWQLDMLTADETAAGRAFWEQRPVDVPLTDPLRDPRLAAAGDFTPAAVPIEPGTELAGQVGILAERAGVPLRTVALAAWLILFRRIAGEDVLLALVGENRPHEEMRGAVGAFVQPLPWVVALEEGRSVLELLTDVDAGAGELLRQQQFRDTAASGGAPLARLAFDWLQEPVSTDSADGWRLVEAVSYAEPFSLRLSGVQTEDRFDLTLHHDSSWLPGSQIGRLVELYLQVLREAVTNPSADWARLSLTGPTEQELLPAPAGATPAGGPAIAQRCIHEVFEEQAGIRPDAPAVVAEDGELTMRELNERANRLGHHLRELGVRPDMPVGLLGTRSLDFVIGLLGIMKAGGAYVPLDPGSPAARRNELLARAGARIVVADPAAMEGVSGDVTLVDPRSPAPAAGAAGNPAGGARPANLVYVIFTSGSSGAAKAVGVSHGSLDAYVRGVSDRLGVQAGWRFGVVSGFAADLGHTVLFTSLCSGGVLVMAPGELVGDALGLAGFFRRFPVDCLKVTPSHMRALLDGGDPAVVPSSVLVVGGEVLDWDLVGRVRELAPKCRVVNHYGPTETTVGVLSFEVPAGVVSGVDSVPLGRGLGDARVLVLDEEMRPAPAWVEGEVCVGGPGVARGYLGRGGLTAERFAPDPFDGGGGRLYRTGDRARRLSDGSLVFVGRGDDQVKVRGFRVEPGEVAAVLRRHAGVREAVVVTERAQGGVRLVAYGVWDGLGAEELRGHCAGLLPDYMVPGAFVGLDRMPLLGNGKVDRRALPPAGSDAPSVTVFEAPAGVVEGLLAEVWAGVLGVARVGRGDDFFELGGDSISSIQVVARAARAGLSLTPRLLFQHRTIAEVAPFVRSVSGVAVAEQGTATGPVPPTPIQSWFLGGGITSQSHYNQAMVLGVRGGVDVAALHSALRALVEHHDALRLRLAGSALEITGVHEPEGLLTVVDAPAGADSAWWEELAGGAQAGMDLGSGCLLRAVCALSAAGGEDRLLLVGHHLAVDGVSWRILLEDLATAYRQALEGVPVRLPAKTTDYRTWAEHLARRAQSRKLLEQLPYWTKTLDAVAAPAPASGEPGSYGQARSVSSVLSAETTTDLLRSAGSGSALELLLTALGRTLAGWTGEPDMVIDIEGHGRDTDDEGIDVSRTVGWFTTLYPVRLTALAGESLAETLRRTAQRLAEPAELPDGGAGFGLLKYGRIDAATAELRSLPAPSVRFNYLGQLTDDGEDGTFALTQESTGATADPQGRRPYPLDITAVVLAGQLRMSWSYSPALDRSEQIEGLAERCLHELKALVAADRPDASSPGPDTADFAESGLDEDELAGLLGQFDSLMGDE